MRLTLSPYKHRTCVASTTTEAKTNTHTFLVVSRQICLHARADPCLGGHVALRGFALSTLCSQPRLPAMHWICWLDLSATSHPCFQAIYLSIGRFTYRFRLVSPGSCTVAKSILTRGNVSKMLSMLDVAVCVTATDNFLDVLHCLVARFSKGCGCTVFKLDTHVVRVSNHTYPLKFQNRSIYPYTRCKDGDTTAGKL